jgi:hypothetical protein
VSAGGSFPNYYFTYTDDTLPTIGNVTFAKGATKVIVPPAGKTTRLQARMKDSCSGVAVGAPYVAINGTLLAPIGLTPSGNNGQWFNVLAKSTPLSLTSTTVGRWTFPFALVADRYSSFQLDKDHKWMSGPEVARAAPVFRELNGPTLYVLKKTRATNVASKKHVPAGGKVTFRTAVDQAGTGTWEDFSGAKVKLQSRVGSGRWKTLATRTANLAGKVSASVKAHQTASFRWLVVQNTGTTFTAKSTSKASTVSVP